MLHEHPYFSSLNQSANSFLVVSSLPFRCWCATSTFKISATSVHVLWIFGFMESALWFHGVITHAIHIMRNTTESFTCDWDFFGCDPLRGFITSGHLGLGDSDFLITLNPLAGKVCFIGIFLPVTHYVASSLRDTSD